MLFGVKIIQVYKMCVNVTCEIIEQKSETNGDVGFGSNENITNVANNSH